MAHESHWQSLSQRNDSFHWINDKSRHFDDHVRTVDAIKRQCVNTRIVRSRFLDNCHQNNRGNQLNACINVFLS